MSKNQKNTRQERSQSGFDHLSSGSDFYSASPSERPLSDGNQNSDSRRVRKTGRHQAVSSNRSKKMDPREKMALMGILKSVIMILLLMITFFMLWKGISLYEESVWLEHSGGPEKSPVLQAVELIEDFDIRDQDSREKFGERVERWKTADRLVRSADVLQRHNNYDQAIAQCQDALRNDPSHRGALERLGRLYDAKGNHIEAVNAFIRLLSVDPSDVKVQKQLIHSLDALGDHRAVKYMTEWYLDQNMYDSDVQRYLANSLYAQEDFEAAVTAYDRVLREAPKDTQALEQQAAAYMQLQQFDKALVSLGKLHEHNLRNPDYYKKIVVCNAQLQLGKETVQALGRAAHLFGEKMVMMWIQDPQLDPVREDRTFQAFTDRVGGEEFRRWLEQIANSMDADANQPDIGPQLEMPSSEFQGDDLLKLRNRQSTPARR